MCELQPQQMRPLFLRALNFISELVSSKPIHPRIIPAAQPPLSFSDAGWEMSYRTQGKLVFPCLFIIVANIDQHTGTWERYGTCSRGIEIPLFFPNGNQDSRLRCCIAVDCTIVGIQKAGFCRDKSNCPDQDIQRSGGTAVHQEFTKQFVAGFFRFPSCSLS